MQESFRTAISVARWFHRALNFNNTKFPGACDVFFIGSQNSFNKNLLSPRNNGFIVFFIFSIALIRFFNCTHLLSLTCNENNVAIFLIRIVEEGVGEAAESRDGTGIHRMYIGSAHDSW